MIDSLSLQKLTSSFAVLAHSMAALSARISAWKTVLAMLSLAFQVLVTAWISMAQKALTSLMFIFQLSAHISFGVLLEGHCRPCEILSPMLISAGCIIDGGDGCSKLSLSKCIPS
ncbi:hypothetical protein AVEN_90250-1 [Araneus ventricosus]|uniref:Uncharacterized protein n=1 Tax=Araneus ventricosus TaxID=182803 RepID=A0A4Y2G6K7_ARAVE|nr:hypothetical protein AVEN_90250-1 [Araneus ventricosus]